MKNDAPHLRSGQYAVSGALAEILSVLGDSTLWKQDLREPVSISELIRALDTKRPAEERLTEIISIIEALRRTARLAKWIPWYPHLPEHEYRNQFYTAYRDHTAHTLQVYLLGLYFFETVGSLREPLTERLRQSIATTAFSDRSLFLEWWSLTALWHDLGYPFEATEFISDPSTRKGILESISGTLGKDPFAERFESPLAPQLKRQIYQVGHYYPFEILSTGQLLQHRRASKTINNMWHRLGVGLTVDSPLMEFDLLTSQDPPAHRPPYHDHGLLGASLLAFLADETESFFAHLADAFFDNPNNNSLHTIQSEAEKVWESLIDLSEITNMAVEAIAFHNISFTQLSTSRSINHLIPNNFQTNLQLTSEPHLFFLGLTDTLQDWDRYHYLPNSPGSYYRPSTPASDLMLQGNGDRIRVSLPNSGDSKTSIARLFTGWLNKNDIDSLFDENPTFSKPATLSAYVVTDLKSVDRSSTETRRLLGLISENTSKAKKILILGGSDSVMAASSLLEGVLRQVRESDKLLNLSDKETIDKHIQTEGLNRLRAQAYALIENGCRLPLGVVNGKIGEGGFGAVYQVSEQGEKTHGRNYAFKLYHERDLSNQEKLRLFRRGFEAMQSLNDHPNVVSVYLFSEVPLGFFMEFIPGPNLEDGIDQLKEIHDRLEVGLKIAETLSNAHNRPRQVVHRDIKPGNVLLDASNGLNPILTDFDLAWIESRQTQLTSQLYANMHYGAPEQSEVRWKDYRQKPCVDVYSVGALIYFLLLKQDPPPWHAWTPVHWSLLENRLEGQIPATVVLGLADTLKKMVALELKKECRQWTKQFGI